MRAIFLTCVTFIRIFIWLFLIIISNDLSAQIEVCGILDPPSMAPPNLPRMDLHPPGSRETLTRNTAGPQRVVVHFTTAEGNDATTRPHAQNVANIAEEVWDKFFKPTSEGGLGWPVPPSDLSGSGVALNPDGKMDIFIADLDRRNIGGARAVVYWETLVPNPATYPNGRSSFVELDRSQSDHFAPPYTIDFDVYLRALVAHEMHHVVQNYYYRYPENAYPDMTRYSGWMYEQTATTLEDLFDDNVNTLQSRLNLADFSPLSFPALPLDHEELTYEGATWTTFLNENYGNDASGVNVLTRIWEKIGTEMGTNYNYVPAINSALSTYYSSSFGDAVRQYAVWRYFTGSRDDGKHFQEAEHWPTSSVLRNHTSYTNLSGKEDQSYLPMAPGGANFIQMPAGQEVIQVTFNGNEDTGQDDDPMGSPETYSWQVGVIGYRNPDGPPSNTINQGYEADLALNSTTHAGQATIRVHESTLIPIDKNIDNLVLAIVNTSNALIPNPDGNPQNFYPVYTYGASVVTSQPNVVFQVLPGWNLISVPTVLSNFSFTSAFPTAISQAFEYTGSATPSVTNLQNGKGYWAKFDGLQNVSHTGKQFDILWEPVHPGWNIVGSTHQDFPIRKIFPSHGISRMSKYLGYSYSGGYVAADDIGWIHYLNKGKGYWMKVSDAGYLTYNSTTPWEAPLPSTIDPNPPPAPPANLPSAPALNCSNCQTALAHPSFSWNSVSGAVLYKLYRYVCQFGEGDCELNGSEIYSGSNLSFTDNAITIFQKTGDNPVPTETWFYYVKAVDEFEQASVASNKKTVNSTGAGGGDPTKTMHGIVADERIESLPTETRLLGSYPNPFNPVARIDYTISADTRVSLKVFNTYGQEVAALINEYQSAGYKSINFDASNFPSGMYFYRLQAGNFMDTKKMLLMK